MRVFLIDYEVDLIRLINLTRIADNTNTIQKMIQ